MQLAAPAYQGAPSTLIFALKGFDAEVLRTGPDVGRPSESILQGAVGLPDHRCVKARSGHDGESFAVEPTDIELAPVAVEADHDRLLDVLRDAEVRREKIGSAGRQDRERRLRAAHRVDRALDGSVASPDEEQIGALRERALHLLRCEAALRHFDPDRIADSLTREFAPELHQAAAERFAGVCDHGDLGHFAALPDARVTSTSADSAAIPTIAPPAMSIGWCIPRYMREKAT